MGVLYYALNRTKKQYYELGKTPLDKQDWSNGYTNPSDFPLPFSVEDLTKALDKVWPDCDNRKRVIAELMAMSVEDVVSDYEDGMDDCGDYVCVGTIYTAPEHQDAIGKTHDEYYDL